MIQIGIQIKDTGKGTTALSIAPNSKGDVTKQEFEIGVMAVYLVHKINELLEAPQGTTTIEVDPEEVRELAGQLANNMDISPRNMVDASMPDDCKGENTLC
jgi:hypothetical protein